MGVLFPLCGVSVLYGRALISHYGSYHVEAGPCFISSPDVTGGLQGPRRALISSDGGGARIGSFGTVLSQFQREDCDKAQACMSKHPAWPEDGWRRLYMVISGFVVWILLGFGPYDHIQ